MAGVYRMTCPRAEAMPSQQWIAWVHPLSMHVLKLQGRWMHLSWSSTLEIGQWFLFHQMHVTKKATEIYTGNIILELVAWICLNDLGPRTTVFFLLTRFRVVNPIYKCWTRAVWPRVSSPPMAGKPKTPLVDKLPTSTSTGKRRVGRFKDWAMAWLGCHFYQVSSRSCPIGWEEDLSSSTLHRIQGYIPTKDFHHFSGGMTIHSKRRLWPVFLMWNPMTKLGLFDLNKNTWITWTTTW